MLNASGLYINKSPDLDLIAGFKQTGNASLIGELYKRYSRFVFHVCMKYLKNEDDSKDAVMQIFEKLLDSLKRFEVDNFKPWLHSVTKNHCLIYLRNEGYRMRKREEIKNEAPSFMESEDNLYLDIENDKETKLKYLEECIEHLKTDQRECIVLFYLQDKCYNEVSSITGYDMKKVKSYIQNGKRNLKICIEDKYNG
ncbi:MAG: sigma-70 family RNA polymerase sigma factor [Bacteroidetes bacterium]|nr:sigma-70 family RNA polymerase sigma factor [Bacteroidota bacterium]